MNACPRCNSLRSSIGFTRNDLGDTRGKLARYQGQEDHAKVERYAAEVLRLQEQLQDQEIEFEVHQAEEHPEPSRKAPTIMNLDNDAAPSHRKPKLPPMADVAAMIVAGETLEEVAATFEWSTSALGSRLNAAGYNAVTGEPKHRRTDPDDGLPILGLVFQDQAWRADSVCATTDPEAFFPEKGNSTREAKKVCLTCDVRSDCLEYAITNNERFGVWGGLSERERRRLVRSRQEPA